MSVVVGSLFDQVEDVLGVEIDIGDPVFRYRAGDPDKTQLCGWRQGSER